MTPPKRGLRSSRSTGRPSCFKRHAHASPEIPPPMTGIWERAGTRRGELKRLREERLFGQMLLLEVRVENHGEIADEDASQESHADFAGSQLDEPVFNE